MMGTGVLQLAHTVVFLPIRSWCSPYYHNDIIHKLTARLSIVAIVVFVVVIIFVIVVMVVFVVIVVNVIINVVVS